MKAAELSTFAVNTDSCNLLKLLYSKTSKKNTGKRSEYMCIFCIIVQNLV